VHGTLDDGPLRRGADAIKVMAADLLVVNGDPLADIAVLQHPET
jgi:imidazolonepropionase-like amidohydrolase